MAELRVGDLVVTADHGAQPVRWIQRTHHEWEPSPHKDKPIHFAKGSLGAGLPHRDLIVSPQHRMLVPDLDTPGGTLAPAKAFLDLPKVRQMRGRRRINYVHLMFDRHEVIFAEGTPSESFYPGEYIMRNLCPEDRDDVRRVILRDASRWDAAGYAPARRFSKVGELRKSRQLVAPIWTEARLTGAGLAASAGLAENRSMRPKRVNEAMPGPGGDAVQLLRRRFRQQF